MAYGQKLRKYRFDKQFTLKDLSLLTDIDTAYISRIERETINPPQDEELIDSINKALKLSSSECQEMKDLAAFENKKYPLDVARKVKDLEGFPMFLRTVSNKKLTTEKLKSIMDFINERY